MAFMAAAAPYMMAASAGMSILGGIQQSAAQRAQGDAAYQNALQRAKMAQIQAQQLRDQANATAGAGQVQADQERQKAQLMAGRAKAVMAASGAGVDPNLVAGLVGQGEFNANTSMWNANEKARGLRNQAAMDDYSGQAGIWSGGVSRNNAYRAADNTLIGSIGKGALSFASYYGSGGPPTSSKYNLELDSARTANDADLGGYGGGYGVAAV